MRRLKDISNAGGINIHATKEFLRGDDSKIIVGELTNWIGININLKWVNLTISKTGTIIDYNFSFSEYEAIGYSNDKFTDIDYNMVIDYRGQIESITGWNPNTMHHNTFQSCVLDNYMKYEAIYVDNINITINNNNFVITGNVLDINNDDFLFRFKAVPFIDNYDISWYSFNGKKLNTVGKMQTETNICGASGEEVENAIYNVISSRIYCAMVNTLPISILVKTCYYINDVHKKNHNAPTAKDYIKELFIYGIIDLFLEEFMMSLIGKDGNIYT